MQEQINNLQKQIDELKKTLSEKDMPMELREIMRNEVIKDQTSGVYEQAGIAINAVPVVITGVPSLNDGTLIIKWKGKEYKIPYYV